MDLSPISIDGGRATPLPPCTGPINQAWFDQITKQIDDAVSEVSLQALVDEVYATIAMLKSTITSQIESMLPFQSLTVGLTSSAGLGEIIGWINNATEAFAVMYAAEAKLAAQIGQLGEQVKSINDAINNVTNLNSWHIDLPSLEVFCTL